SERPLACPRDAVVESGAGAVAVRSGAVQASHCRRCGPETVPRFQSPLIKPCMRFSRTRLSEVLHRTAFGVAVYHSTVHSRGTAAWTRLRGPIQRPLQRSRLVSGGCSPWGTHQRFTPSDAWTKYGAFPPRWLCCPPDQQYYAPFRLPLRSHPLRRSSRLIGLGAPK